MHPLWLDNRCSGQRCSHFSWPDTVLPGETRQRRGDGRTRDPSQDAEYGSPDMKGWQRRGKYAVGSADGSLSLSVGNMPGGDKLMYLFNT